MSAPAISAPATRARRPADPAAPAPAPARVPIWFWVPAALLPALAWLFLLPFQSATGPPFLDWNIYRHGLDLWVARGAPYEALPPGWDPFRVHPYLYPPTSWPLMLLAAAVPAALAGLGALPLLLRPPRLRLVPACAALLVLGLGPALYLANVNLLVAGLIVLSFLPGRWGGLAFAALVAMKLYPIVLLPLLWGDRTRLRWFLGAITALLVSGTAFFGAAGWQTWLVTLLNEGPHPDISWNPFTTVGPLRVVPAGLIALAGLAARSPSLALLGATWASGVVTSHYLVTFAAVLAVEPPLRHSLAHLRSLGGMAWAQRIGWRAGPAIPANRP